MVSRLGNVVSILLEMLPWIHESRPRRCWIADSFLFGFGQYADEYGPNRIVRMNLNDGSEPGIPVALFQTSMRPSSALSRTLPGAAAVSQFTVSADGQQSNRERC